MKQRTILLFQLHLRVHILNFGKALKHFQFVVKSDKYASTKNFYKQSMQTPEKEFSRSKLDWKNRLRRLFGILNIRPRFTKKYDALFTYGCLLLTNKPYCTYIENGVALFNYDPFILRNPLARFWFSFLIRLPQCKKLIFMSDTAKQSLLATGRFSLSTGKVIEKKSVQVYPLVPAPKDIAPKKFTGHLKLLFTGIYYVKGGRELVHAFKEVRARHQNVSLTLVTPLHMLLPEDREYISSISEITLLDATFNQEEMQKLYHKHDVFLFPTFRDTFGLVLIEALSLGMPIICTDQYATTEMAIHEYNAFVFPNHPLLDYNQKTKEMHGRLYNAKTFYDALFEAEKKGEMKELEDFLFHSIERFILDHNLLEKFSKNSIELYNKKFHQDIISKKIEDVFLEMIGKR